MIDDRTLLESQQAIHELIARQLPLNETLNAIATWINRTIPDAIVSVMRLDPELNTLSLVPSSSFSERYLEALQSIPVVAMQGTCGTAAYERRLVVTEDIREDSRWEGFHDIAEAEGLRACWSIPIITGLGELLGTFATYYRYPMSPTDSDRKSLECGAALAALVLLRDRETRAHLALSEWYQALFNNQPDGVFAYDLKGCLHSCNGALERISGYSQADIVGSHFNDFVEPTYRAQTLTAFEKASRGESTAYEIQAIHKAGHCFHLEVSNFPVVIGGKIVGVYGVCRDITRRNEQEEQIRFQARHDVLTGLPNLETFTTTLGKVLKTYEGQSGRTAVLYLDLDGFKPINEGLGHSIGNQVLITVADRLVSIAGHTATVARLIGDEFGVLLSGNDSQQKAAELADRFLEAVAEPIVVDNQRVHLSASIGIASNGPQPEQPHELLQYADLALHQAQRQGRNTWQWFRGQRVEKNRHTVTLRRDLYIALNEEQFELHYQPLVDTVSGQLRGVEALVRWRHPTRGIISPGEFIPLAEQTGQIIPLGRWILRQACLDMVDFSAVTGRDLQVAVNISSLQFLRDGFLEDVQRTLADSGLPPTLLELEVTESVLLDGVEPVIELMRTLKAMHIQVALDDFGTGYSSLSYLRDLPVHRVKLDQSFIQAIETDDRMAAIVQAVITMAHSMDMSVVAEGIETQKQQQDLARRHCDLLQGYYFARPMPLADLKELPHLLPKFRSVENG